jgi:hypothetical protein
MIKKIIIILIISIIIVGNLYALNPDEAFRYIGKTVYIEVNNGYPFHNIIGEVYSVRCDKILLLNKDGQKFIYIDVYDIIIIKVL